MNEKDKAINDLAQKFHEDCYKDIPENFYHNAFDFQSWTNHYFFRKLAELQLEINELKNK